MKNIINRKHKDRLFCSIFKEKKKLLSLYNAINETNYTDEELLTVNTLDNAIYMTMKNDILFLIYGILNLYEHQSTWNPNMPLRDFLYVAQQIKIMIDENEWDIYGSKLVKIPTPQAIVFYNGKEHQPERQILKLSDAVEHAIEDCIKENVLADYLRLYRSEVKNLILSEYDEQKHIENEKRWSYEEGCDQASKLYELLLQDDRQEEMKLSLKDKILRQKLMQEYDLIK